MDATAGTYREHFLTKSRRLLAIVSSETPVRQKSFASAHVPGQRIVSPASRIAACTAGRVT
jgi:hypothetical protein